jgi:magnesium-transporting ATPase (P-type)
MVGSFKDLESLDTSFRYIHFQEHPFDPCLKRMTVIYHDFQCQELLAFTKGSTESVLDICNFNEAGKPLTEEYRMQILEKLDHFASTGLVPPNCL